MTSDEILGDTRLVSSFILTIMNTVFRQFTRTALSKNTSLAFCRSLPRPAALHRPVNSTILHARAVASFVTNKPASQSLEHAATNIKEEVGNSAADFAKAIAGTNVTKDSVIRGEESFLKITGLVASEVPRPVMLFGLLGGLPYVGASITTVYLAHSAQLATTGVFTNIDPGVALTILDQALNIQVTYGAVMLSFLGALHWGMEFSGYGGQKGYARLALGAAPVLFAWPTLALQPMYALIWQWIGFTGLWYADSKATSNGWAPKWYSQYRFYLSLLGSSIIGSLAGTSYYGPVAGHGLLSHDLDLLREQRKELLPIQTNVIPGDLEVTPAGETAPHYVRIHKKRHDDVGTGEKQEN